jgi:hypothetical protein
MTIHPFVKIAGALALTLSLTGCLDMTNDIYVTSSTTARATITSTMGAEIYGMVKAGGDNDEPFCSEQGATLTENADGSATCVDVSEGNFADLDFDDGGSKPMFTSNPDGTVRIAIPTKDMMTDLSGDDPETAAMMKQLFEGRFLTIRFGGSQIVESNMERAPDSGQYVETKISFIELMDGTAKLPAELYAVVRP